MLSAAKTIENTSCYHCGEECKDPVKLGDKNFCCRGCKTVFEILHQNDLTSYYRIENKPGISLQNKARSNFEFLDESKVADKLIEFRNEAITIVTFYLPAIHCSSCIWLLENLQKLDAGIKAGRVNFLKKEVQITFLHDKLSLRKVAELLASIGYPPEINLNDLEKPVKKKIDKTLIYQVGVAGFCFGNIMLLSLPEYFGLDQIAELGFARFFGLINVLLALPLTFYSARNYFSSAYNVLKHKNINIDVPIALGILVLFLRSTFEVASSSGPGYFDSLAGLVFFLLLGKIFQQKTYDTLSFERDYKSYFPVAVTKIYGKDKPLEKSSPVSELKKGDRILIRNNELIPVDSILISEEAHIDNSFVTGESRPVSKKSGDKIYAGGKQKGKAIELEVIKALSKSSLTRIWDSGEKDKEGVRLDNITDSVSRYFTVIILFIALATYVYWSFYDHKTAINAFTAVLIIACPCALALSAPFTLGNVLRIFGKEKFYVKNAEVIERMAGTGHIIFDKTGTLTRNDRALIRYEGEPLLEEESSALKSILRQSSHPLSKMLYKHLRQNTYGNVDAFNEIPGKGIEGKAGKYFIRAGNKAFAWGEKGRSVSKTTSVYIAIDGQPKGFYTYRNHYRHGLAEVLSPLKSKHELAMISGDNDNEKERLKKIFGKEAQLLFRQSPENKAHYITKLKEEGKRPMMIGDGLNDAGALMRSHTGISISENINTFSPACDAILDASKFGRLPDFLRFTRLSMNIIVISFIISFLYNITGMFFAVQGLLSPVFAAILMPLSSITVVGFVTLSTNVTARLMKFNK